MSLYSVIDDRCSLKEAYSRVVKQFDPNKGRNRKTKVLDCSNSNVWQEEDLRLYDILNTKNIETIKHQSKNHFEMIIYEPPRNQTLLSTSELYAKEFNNILNSSGIVICRINDFNLKGSLGIKGSFELQTAFNSGMFFLADKIIYRYNQFCEDFNKNDRVHIVHSYFMVFKKSPASFM